MKLQIVGRSPPTDGTSHWRFPQGAVMIRAGTHKELIERVFEFRLRNYIPTGDIEREISDWYCAQFPRFCHEDGDGIGPSAKQKAAAMLQRVAQWVSNLARKMPRGGYPLVTAAEADARATICAQCPKNGHWKSGCGGCDAATLQLLQSVKQLKKTIRDGNLAACEVGGWENSTAIWMPKEQLALSPEQIAQLPTPCWRKGL